MKGPPSKKHRISSMVSISWGLGSNPTYKDEMDMKHVLIRSPYESGRGFDLPLIRQHEIEEQALMRGFTITGAMSLRRQFIRAMSYGGSFHSERSMGSASDSNSHAENFERAVEKFLRSHSDLTVVVESSLKKVGLTRTPDFLFPHGCIINGRMVNWLDCKTYFGSSALACNPKLAIGKIRNQFEKYFQVYGAGGFIFLNGFSSDLLERAGMVDVADSVILLDATPIDTSSLFDIRNHTDMVCQVEIICPKQRLGVVIGKNGATLRNLKSTFGCNFIIHEGDPSIVVISGVCSNLVASAKEVVDDLIQARTSPKCSKDIQCPISRIPLIIGKQGTTVRKIMNKTGCKVITDKDNVSSDGNHQVVKILGKYRANVDQAENIIRTIIQTGRSVAL